MNDQPVVQQEAKTFPCSSCGAKLEYAPGKSALKCPYCGAENKIEAQQAMLVEELDFYEFFARATEQGESEEKQTVKCGSCNAVSTLDAHMSLAKCPFCGSQLTAPAKPLRLIKPGAVLPFKVTRAKAADEFRTWLSSLWFAPGELKNYATTSGGIKGLYLPYWTYDARVTTQYEGERGEDYYETEYYDEEDGDGNVVRKSRTVTRTRWYHASGWVENVFDDVLVPAGRSLPPEVVTTLEPWDLKNLVPYADEYMSGFQAEAYQLDLGDGFEQAKSLMDGAVRRSVEHDIGGQHQRVTTVRCQYDDITFKHVLLPVWLSAYRYRDKTYRFIVNARTGQVQGERPWSVAKIALAVVGVLVLLLVIAVLVKK